MRLLRYSLAVIMGISLPNLAHADTVFMVQLGSFSSAEEAESHWNLLSEENTKLLDGLTNVNSRISLPPENTTSYRLQAGPITSRIEAKNICSTLRKEDEECFVVETAMFIGDEKSTMEASVPVTEVNVSALETAVTEETAATAAAVTTTSSVFADITDALIAPFSSSEESEIEIESDSEEFADLSDIPEESELLEEAPIEAQEMEAELDTNVEVVAETEIEDAIEEVADTQDVTLEQTLEAETDETISALVEESEKRIEEMATTSDAVDAEVEPEISAADTTEIVEDNSLFRLSLPWSKKDNKNSKAQADNLPVAVVQPTETADELVLPKIEKPNVEIKAVKAESPVAEITEASEEVTAEAGLPVLPIRNASAGRTSLKNEVIVQKLPGIQMVTVDGRRYTPSVPARSSVTIAPTQMAKTTLPVMEAPTVEIPAMAETASTEGSVEVMEAIPVPLSDITAASEEVVEETITTTQNVGLPVYRKRRALGAGGTPSQNFLQKSYWVKLNYFSDDSSAKKHWRQLQRSKPTITKNLRMRVTSPYSQRGNVKRVSMQLGPFLNYQGVQELCKVAGKPGIVCEIQRDTGISTAARTRRADDNGRLLTRRNIAQQSRSKARHVNSVYRGQYWAQLGSYRNRGVAMKAWDEMKSQNPALENRFPHLEYPNRTNTEQAAYRLRTGPYATRAAAEALCGKLDSDSGACVVVNR